MLYEMMQLSVVCELVDVKVFASSDHDTSPNYGLAQAVGAPKASVITSIEGATNNRAASLGGAAARWTCTLIFLDNEGSQHTRTTKEPENETRREPRSMIGEMTDTRSQNNTHTKIDQDTRRVARRVRAQGQPILL